MYRSFELIQNITTKFEATVLIRFKMSKSSGLTSQQRHLRNANRSTTI
jgi:hypothetical protein